MRKTIALLITTSLLTGCSAMFSKFFRKSQKPTPTPEPASVYKQLREQVLTTSPGEVGISPSEENPNVWGILMETGLPEGKGVYTLVLLADGTTSLYLSQGGGILGGGGHEAIAKATKARVTEAEKYYKELPQTTSYPLPAVGNVRFFFLIYSGVRTVEVDQIELGENKHQLSPFFHGCHNVLTLLLKVEEQKK